jgi:hypothetical protein
MLTALSVSAIAAAATIFYSRRSLCYLRHFQDNDYSQRLFTNWVVENGIYDRKGSLIATVAALVLEVTQPGRIISLVICFFAAAVLIWLGSQEADPRIAGYPLLQPTPKARWIYHFGLNLYMIFFLACVGIVYRISADKDLAAYWLIVIIAIQSSPLWLMIANVLSAHRRI